MATDTGTENKAVDKIPPEWENLISKSRSVTVRHLWFIGFFFAFIMALISGAALFFMPAASIAELQKHVTVSAGAG